jgi:ABC-2 type transport system permease protein
MTAAGTASANAPFDARRNLVRLYGLEAKSEIVKALRMPAYALPTIAFPLVFYVLFGIVFGTGRPVGGVGMATYLLASYGAFGVIGAALFGFGVGVAVERGQGWMLLKRASAMPISAYFGAKIALCLVFSVLIVVGLFTIGVTLGNVQLPTATWLRLGGTLVLGALPFSAFGLALGYLVGPNAAPALVNLIYLPMAFFSGLWFPIEALPKAVQAAAPALPAYHFGQLAFQALGAGRGGSPWVHLGYLLVFAAVSLAVGAWAFRRDEDRTFG